MGSTGKLVASLIQLVSLLISLDLCCCHNSGTSFLSIMKSISSQSKLSLWTCNYFEQLKSYVACGAITFCVQAFSSLAHEAMLHARTIGIKVVYTDHSLFGFADASSIVTNKVLKFSLAGVDHAICVSHTRFVLCLEWDV